jgi:hypothetical protein
MLSHSVKDSLADAETLQNIHDAYVGFTQCWEAPYPPQPGFACCQLAECNGWASVIKLVRTLHGDETDWSGYAEEAAHAAFRAVPALKGED